MSERSLPPGSEQTIARHHTGAGDGLVERLAATLGAHASASAVYGPAVERGAFTVIPVASVRWVFGGGGGLGRATERTGAEGSGGGGGLRVSPVGYITVGDEGVAFHPITAPRRAVLLAAILSAGATLAAVMVLRTGGARRTR